MLVGTSRTRLEHTFAAALYALSNLGEGDKFSYMPVAGIQEIDENMIKLGGVLEGIRTASDWPGANKDESR